MFSFHAWHNAQFLTSAGAVTASSRWHREPSIVQHCFVQQCCSKRQFPVGFKAYSSPNANGLFKIKRKQVPFNKISQFYTHKLSYWWAYLLLFEEVFTLLHFSKRNLQKFLSSNLFTGEFHAYSVNIDILNEERFIWRWLLEWFMVIDHIYSNHLEL